MVTGKEDVMLAEWGTEPNTEKFTAFGLPCAIRRHTTLLHLCGYVGVPRGHPAYGMNYDDLPITVHGGLTFGEMGDGKFMSADYYWLGFDCSHAYDLTPGLPLHLGETYRNWAYVKGEVEHLAEQLATMQGKT